MNCKPGDLAVIVSCDEWEPPVDLGRFVRVLRAGSSWADEGDSRHHWRCTALDGAPMVCAAPPIYVPAMSAPGAALDFPDCHLRPIRGDTVPTADVERETEYAHA